MIRRKGRPYGISLCEERLPEIEDPELLESLMGEPRKYEHTADPEKNVVPWPENLDLLGLLFPDED